MNVRDSSLLLVIACCALLEVPGCGGANTSRAAQEKSNLKPLAVFYGQYQGQHRGQTPKDEASFKAFLKAIPPSQLATFEVTDVDSLFISSRDKKPYVIKYGVAPGPPGPGGPSVIAYEQEGVDGKRWVATSVGAVVEVDEASFRSMVPDAK